MRRNLILLFGALALMAAGRPTASIRVLDVLTAEVKTLKIPVGKTVRHGPLIITAHACVSSAEPNADKAYVTVEGPTTNAPDSDVDTLFSGWLFAATPSLSAMDHPRYDIGVAGCT
jgi:hypothetical protein